MTLNTEVCIHAWCINWTVVFYFKQGNIKQIGEQWGHLVRTLSLFVCTCTVIIENTKLFSGVSGFTGDIQYVWYVWLEVPWGQPSCFLHALMYLYVCVYPCNSSSYLVEALQTLFDLHKGRVWGTNFDFWVLSLGVQTISHNSARVTEKKKSVRGWLYLVIHFGVFYYHF